jgi:TPR repeat protein
MFARIAICLTLLFSAGTTFAEEGKRPQAASWQLQASLTQGAEPAGQEIAAGSSVAKPDREALIREGNKRMREGDILGARQSYQKAVASGDAAAALVMGRSYDPIYFAKIAQRNAEPDPAQAFEWYRRAMNAGAAQTAMVRIEDLKGFLGK